MTAGDLSNVGTAGVYESKDQKAPEQPKTVNPNPEYEQGKKDSHKSTDPKDERSIANRLEAELKQSDDSARSQEDRARDIDPTLPAKMHGNEPSKGAKVDAELQAEEQEILKKKGAFGPSASN